MSVKCLCAPVCFHVGSHLTAHSILWQPREAGIGSPFYGWGNRSSEWLKRFVPGLVQPRLHACRCQAPQCAELHHEHSCRKGSRQGRGCGVGCWDQTRVSLWVTRALPTTPLSIALRQTCLRHSPRGTRAATRHLSTHLLPAPFAHPLCSGPPPDVWWQGCLQLTDSCEWTLTGCSDWIQEQLVLGKTRPLAKPPP